MHGSHMWQDEVEEIQAHPEVQHATSKEKRFRCNKDEKVNHLIRCLANYKSQCEYNNRGFNADKVKQYEAVRVAINTINTPKWQAS